MTKKDFFGKHNGEYCRKFKDGGYARLYLNICNFYIIDIHRNGHAIERRTLGIDGFGWAWRSFQNCLKEARKPYEFPEV